MYGRYDTYFVICCIPVSETNNSMVFIILIGDETKHTYIKFRSDVRFVEIIKCFKFIAIYLKNTRLPIQHSSLTGTFNIISQVKFICNIDIIYTS